MTNLEKVIATLTEWELLAKKFLQAPNRGIDVEACVNSFESLMQTPGVEVLSRAIFCSYKRRYYEEALDLVHGSGWVSAGLYIDRWTDSESLHGAINKAMSDLFKKESLPDGLDKVIGLNRLFGLYDNGNVNNKDYKFKEHLKLEALQLLTPYRSGYFGSLGLNKLIQADYREKPNYSSERSQFYHSDKIIRLNNWYWGWGEKRTLKLSNGSIGICKGENFDRKYYFKELDYPQDNIGSEEDYDLAYAISVHRSQGSDFKNVFLVIPKKSALLSKELVYTALTRSKFRLFLFIQDNEENLLLKARSVSHLLGRNTSIFQPPTDNKAKLIPDASGKPVKSRVEYIIHQSLQRSGLKFKYEQPLLLPKRDYDIHPDFTIELLNGSKIYWEHLGMLDIRKYYRDWQKRIQDYKDHGLFDFVVSTDDLNGIKQEKIDAVIDAIRSQSLKVDKGNRYLQPIGLLMPNGWDLLSQLDGIPNARFTERLLARIIQGEFGERVNFGHCTVPSYPKIDVSHPLLWFLFKNGTVQVGIETVRLTAIVARRHETALTKIPNWDQIQPSLNKLEGAVPPVMAMQADISAFWLALIKELATPQSLADDSLRNLWNGAANDKVVPETLRTVIGETPLSQVFVTGSPDLAQRARREDHLVVALDEHALKLWLEGGARNLAGLMAPKCTEHTGPACLLVSTIPELVEVLRDEVKDSARCQPVAGLELIIAGKSCPVPCLMWDNTLLLDSEQLGSLSRAGRLQCLLAEVAAAGWLKHEPGEALRILGGAQMDALRARVAQGSTLAERLFLAVGNHEEPLRQALGSLAGMDFIKQCAGVQLAELTLAQLGPATLTALKDTLAAEGLNPPMRWNTAEARAFVASIGFPEGFAASPEVRRESEEFISGPIELPPLHDFQEEVLKGVKELLASGTTRRRGVVSLPTGGGKTRVTVEAAVRLVLKPEGDSRSVIWVAQTDELCEQAVQAFRQVWLNIGAQRTDLRIIRLWGGNPNPAIQEQDKPVVVVASIQTLNSRMGTEGLDWLQKPGLVVVDECHHAITPSYTNLLRWLDAEALRLGAPLKNEPPILGLSATPFRTDDTESQRLARRFDNLWLPANQEDLHIRLRQKGVLAEVNTEALKSGVPLLQEEIDKLSKLSESLEGIEFENLLEAINQRLAGSEQRNECLLDRIKAAEECSILLFANTVLHAEEMSARLNLQGIPAASVSGYTPTVARRYFLERFKLGDVRVLCNHSVLSTGFDAPKTDMVLISRAVFSPVRFMQMVGRGLRGEKNGGTANCRIVTVVDNLGRFQDRHPYHYCQKYFARR